MDLIGYFGTAGFWMVTSLSLLGTFVYALFKTGPSEGRMKWQINLVGEGKIERVLFVFVVLEVVLNVSFIVLTEMV